MGKRAQTDAVEHALEETIDGKGSDCRSEQGAQGSQSELNNSVFLVDVLKAQVHGH
jgi:hypothetical protein